MVDGEQRAATSFRIRLFGLRLVTAEETAGQRF